MAQAPVARSFVMPPRESWLPLVEAAIEEDVGPGDLTTEIVVDAEHLGQARIEARASMVVCGLVIAEEVFHQVDPKLQIERESEIEDGVRLRGPSALFRVHGRTRSILAAERVALNFLGRLCGIATQTRSLVDRVADLKVDLVDTRKTTPGWRQLEKYAVAVGGGVNHRVGLFDALLVKDNHIAAAGGLDAAVDRALAKAPHGVPVPGLHAQVLGQVLVGYAVGHRIPRSLEISL